jgi:predicted DNA-binding WGR domain protein
VYERGSSRKFWEGSVAGSTVVVRFGRIGSQGQERRRKLATAAAARSALASLVAEKKKKGYVPEPAKRKPNVPPARRAALIELATELGGRTLAREVTLAVDDPNSYLREFRKRMAAIAVDAPQPNLGWLAITEGLKARKAAVELDWKEEANSVFRRLRPLVGPAGKKALAPLADEDRPTEEALELFGKALASDGIALVQLDKRSDSYVMTVRRPDDVKALTALARKAGGRARWFRGTVLAALEKERRQEEAKWAREEAKARSGNPWTRLLHSVSDGSTHLVLWQLRHRPYPVEEIRAALPYAPKRDRPLIAMVLALHDQPAFTVARATDDPASCLRALEYLGQEQRFGAERLSAAAILAERLGVPPKAGRLGEQVAAACSLYGDPAKLAGVLAKVPPATRDRLARILDELLLRSTPDSGLLTAARIALATVGDQRSIATIEAKRSKLRCENAQRFLDVTIKRIRERLRAGVRSSASRHREASRP